MITDEIVAKEISQLMLSYAQALDKTVEEVEMKCSAKEFEIYRTAIGKIMGYMLLDIMNPLYELHPNLKPKELD
jgi:hypothetical protein